MGNWIKLDRDIRRHWIWQDAVRLQWWVDLLMMAAWEDTERMVRAHKVVLRRGQVLASIAFLTKRWGRNRKMIIKFLQLLTEEGMIMRAEGDSKWGIITICNYAKYQDRGDTNGDTNGDTIKEVKRKQKKEEEVICAKAPRKTSPSSSVFVQPSAEDVGAYACEIGRGGEEAAAFVDYYTACGWRVGRNAMRDWRAAFRGWVRRARADFNGRAETPPGMVLQGTERKVYTGW